MFLLIEHKRTQDKGEYNWDREYSPAVTPEPKQSKGAIRTWWSGTQSSHSEKLKQTDLFLLLCPHAGRQCEQSLNSLNNGVKTSASLALYKYPFGKCSFSRKGLHRWEGDMSNGGPTKVQPASYESASFSKSAGLTDWECTVGLTKGGWGPCLQKVIVKTQFTRDKSFLLKVVVMIPTPVTFR